MVHYTRSTVRRRTRIIPRALRRGWCARPPSLRLRHGSRHQTTYRCIVEHPDGVRSRLRVSSDSHNFHHSTGRDLQKSGDLHQNTIHWHVLHMAPPSDSPGSPIQNYQLHLTTQNTPLKSRHPINGVAFCAIEKELTSSKVHPLPYNAHYARPAVMPVFGKDWSRTARLLLLVAAAAMGHHLSCIIVFFKPHQASSPHDSQP